MLSKTSQTEVLGHIGANIRRARIRLRMTQERLAERAGISAVHLQRVEGGKSNMRVGILLAVADALGVSPGRLFRKVSIPERKPGRPSKGRRKAKPR